MLLNDTIKFTGVIKLYLEKNDARIEKIINESDIYTTLMQKRMNMYLVDTTTIFDKTMLLDNNDSSLQGIYTLNNVIELLTENINLTVLQRSQLHYYYNTLPKHYQECLLTFIDSKYVKDIQNYTL